MRRVVFETAAFGRVVRRGYYDTVSQPAFAVAVVSENCMRDNRGWRIVVLIRQHDVNAVRRQHFESAGQGRPRKRVGIDAEKERSIDSLLLAVNADRLRDGQDMPFVEGSVEG